MEFCPVDTFLRGAWQVWRKLWSRSGQTWSLKLFPNVIRTVMGTGKLESLGSAANLESFECVSPNFRGFWPSRKFSRNPNDFKTFGPSLNPRVIVSLSLLCLHFSLTISSIFSVSIPSSKRKIVRLRPRERSNRILPFFLFQRIKKDNPTQLLKYTDSKIIELLTLSNQSSTILWNHPFEYTWMEQKRNKPRRTKGRAWEKKEREKSTRSVHSRLSLVASRGGTLVFTGARERDLSAPWEHEKCHSQPTSFWFHRGWTTERGGGGGRRTFLKRGNSSIGERGYLFFAMGRGGGLPTHLLRLLFVAASSPVKTN